MIQRRRFYHFRRSARGLRHRRLPASRIAPRHRPARPPAARACQCGCVRAARPFEGAHQPAVDPAAQSRDHAGDVLVAQHAEHRPGLRMEGHVAKIVGQYAAPPADCGRRRARRSGRPGSTWKRPGSSTSARPRRISCIVTGSRSATHPAPPARGRGIVAAGWRRAAPDRPARRGERLPRARRQYCHCAFSGA